MVYLFVVKKEETVLGAKSARIRGWCLLNEDYVIYRL